MGFYHFSLGMGMAYVAGIRAYFPLLMVGLIGRFAEDFPLQPPFRVFTSIPLLLLLIVLMGYEVLAERAASYGDNHAILLLAFKAVVGGVLFAGLFSGFGNFIGVVFGGFVAVLAHFIMG